MVEDSMESFYPSEGDNGANGDPAMYEAMYENIGDGDQGYEIQQDYVDEQPFVNEGSNDDADERISSSQVFKSTIKVYNCDNGWGFIRGTAELDGADIFLHQKNIVGSKPIEHIKEGQGKPVEVSFSIDWSEGSKPKAVNVTILTPQAVSSPALGPVRGQSTVCATCHSTVAWNMNSCAVCNAPVFRLISEVHDDRRSSESKGVSKGSHGSIKGVKKGKK